MKWEDPSAADGHLYTVSSGDQVLLPAYPRKALVLLVLIEADTSKRLDRLAAIHDLEHPLVHVLR